MTAVEKAIYLIHKDYEVNGRLRLAYVSKVLNQAKEMEKQQIIDAYVSGEHQQGFEVEAEQYYNETFKNTNK